MQSTLHQSCNGMALLPKRKRRYRNSKCIILRVTAVIHLGLTLMWLRDGAISTEAFLSSSRNSIQLHRQTILSSTFTHSNGHGRLCHTQQSTITNEQMHHPISTSRGYVANRCNTGLHLHHKQHSSTSFIRGGRHFSNIHDWMDGEDKDNSDSQYGKSDVNNINGMDGSKRSQEDPNDPQKTNSYDLGFAQFLSAQEEQQQRIKDEEERRSAAESLKRFLRSGSGARDKREGSKDAASSNLIEPISLDGSRVGNGESTTDEFDDRGREVVRPNFDSFFQGMPGLNDILEPPSMTDQQTFNKDESETNPSTLDGFKQNGDASAIENDQYLSKEDIKDIDSKLDSFKDSMREKLSQMKKDDTNSVPDNAEQILDHVVKEQRSYDLRERNEIRAAESFDEYEARKRMEWEESVSNSEREASMTDGDGSDAVVREIIEEAEELNEWKLSQEEELNNYREYEESLKKQHAQNLKVDLSPPTTTMGYDELQLKLMSDLLEKRQNSAAENGFEDEDLYLTDNIEDGIEELESKIANDRLQTSASTGPQNQKEWQMYRAIATRLAEEKISILKESGAGEISTEEDAEAIEAQLQAWKDFVAKEEDMRDRAGLSIKVRMPFEWSDKPDDYVSPSRLPSRGPIDKVKSEQAKSELDDLAMKVLSDLMEKTENPERRQKLMREMMELEQQIKERVENLKDQEEQSVLEPRKEPVKPMDINSILKPKRQSMPSPRQVISNAEQSEVDENLRMKRMNSENDEAYEYDLVDAALDIDNGNFPNHQTQQELHENEDYQDYNAIDEYSEQVMEAPKSPFFQEEQDSYEDDTYETYDSGSEEPSPSLGTMEEQKFRSLVARSGVRTVEEQEDLRRKWEEYQQAEQNMRDVTGLSGKVSVDEDSEDVIDMSPPKSAFFSEDVETTVKATSKEDDKASFEEFQKYEEQMKQNMLNEQSAIADKNAIVVDDESLDDEEEIIIHQKRPTQWEASTYADQMYRSVGASNLSKNLGDEEKERSKEAFSDFLEQEEKMRQKIQDISEDSTDVAGNDIDIEQYADQVLSNLSPRPRIQKKAKAKLDDDFTSKNQDNISGEPKGQKKESNLSTSLKKTSYAGSSVLQEQMPDWLRREIEEVRGEEFQLSSDDDEDDDYYSDFESDEDYAEKERQAREFEKKYSSAPKEISIGDMLGRDYFGADDYDDYDERRNSRSSTFSSFEVRKANVLEYTVLSVAELNALMEHKVSTLEISPYLQKINKPYSEFGALFRLEGILVDVSTLHYEAWKKTASMYNFSAPSIDDIKYACVHDAEFVVRRILYWTDDVFMSREVAETFKEVVVDVFQEWVKDNPLGSNRQNGISYMENDGIGMVDIPETQPALIDERDVLELHHSVWCKIAQENGFNIPSIDLVEFGFALPPDQVIKNLFQWPGDEMIHSKFAADFRECLKQETSTWATKQNIDVESLQAPKVDFEMERQVKEPRLDESDLNDIQFYGWTSAAEKYNYELPSIELVELASWVRPEKAVKEIFQWTSDDEEVNKIVEAYRGARRNRSSMYIERLPTDFQNSMKPREGDQEQVEVDMPSGPSEQDVMDVQLRAWEKVSKQFNFDSPTVDQVAAGAFIGPDKAVVSIFKWTDSNDQAATVVASFRDELKELSREWTSTLNKTTTDRYTSSDEYQETQPMFVLKDGVADWLETLQTLEVPCAVLSYMDEEILSYILESTSLDRYFSPERRVSNSNRYPSERQQMLGGALRVERRPDHCIVFDCIPQAAAFAHEVEMKNVAIVSPYPYYELTTADLTSRDLSAISSMNLKNVFSDINADRPMEQLQVEGPQIRVQRQTKTRFWEDGDR